MPRAVIPQRLQAIQQYQRAAVAKREVESAIKKAEEEVAAVAAGVPPDLSTDLAALTTRVDNLESAP